MRFRNAVTGGRGAAVGIARAITRGVVLFAAVAASLEAQSAAKRITIKSQILGRDKSIVVSLPVNYQHAKQKYPVIYVLDGQVRSFVDLAVAAAAYDLLGDIRDFAIPPHIVVAVQHEDRGVDLGRNADAFSKYLTQELAPFIEKEFRASPQRILIGHSLGGRFALMASCRMPGFFPAIIAVSPGGGDSTAYRTTTDCLKSDWRASGGTLRQIYINSGEREQRIDEGAKRLAAFLRDSAPPNVKWKYQDGPGLAHTETPFVGIPAGIKFVHDRLVWEMPLFRSQAILQNAGDAVEIITAWYAELSDRVGFAVPISAKWLDQVTVALLNRGNLIGATRSAEQLVREYPEDLIGYGRLADIKLRAGDRIGARRVLEDGLKMVDRLDFFDEMERALKRKVFQDALRPLNTSGQ
ncbi:MAG: alpha/beta hydrolase-fold protein [Gemmatimonadota bacterium]|nr:alpha/beta hydrolase-fold protein [Gemmatimonadota bacterium]